MKKLTLPALLLLVLAAATDTQEGAEPSDLDGIKAELLARKDDANSDLIRKLANLKTPDSLDALIEVYDVMLSIYMRRVVVQGLVLYDDVKGADQTALQKLMDVATEEDERDLRIAAVDTIADCSNLGKAFLTMIVESSADDEVRERAMRHHTGRPRPEDKDWYVEIYSPSAKVRARKAARRAEDERDKVPHKLQPLRAMAFSALASDLPLEEVVKASEDKNREIRLRAMEELEARGDSDVAEIAEQVYERLQEPSATRVIAARIMVREEGEKVTGKLIKDATRKDVSREFTLGVADILADLNDPRVNKKIVRGFGKGNEVEKIFYLRAAREIEDPKVDKGLLKMIGDKNPEIQLRAMDLAAKRGDEEALPELESLIDRADEPEVLAAALETISVLRKKDPDWGQQLGEYTHSESPEVRNAALSVIANSGDADYLPVLEEALAHDLWSTRLKAARAIQALQKPEGVGLLCQRIAVEEGRMLRELSEILWTLTGKPFDTAGQRWKDWWDAEGEGFEIISASELAKLENERERRRLMLRDSSEFFGIRVISHRVIFIIDVSGSMEDPTRGKFVGEQGPRRMEVAKTELKKCLEGLDVESLFNIIAFSTSVDSWKERISERTSASLDEAKEYVSRMRALGGTNIYEAVQTAFEDPIVDTLYLLSDGEPTYGPVRDPYAIREEVGRWNKNRGVIIHCIAVGGGLKTLQWLAEDSGGNYVKIP